MKSWQIVFTLAFAVATPHARAQSVSGLAPETWNVRTGDRALVHFEREQSGARERAPWSADSLHWLFARHAGEQWNHDDLSAFDAQGGPLPFAFERAGTALIGIDFTPRVERLSGEQLTAFLEGRVNVANLATGWQALEADRMLRVRRWESTKLLVRVEGDAALPPSGIAQSKSGQRAEIRPLADPTYVPIGSDLPLRAYLPFGRAQARVIARRVGGDAALDVTLDAGGMGHFTVTSPGVWVVEVHAARALEADPDGADWEIHSASLRFRAPALERKEEQR